MKILPDQLSVITPAEYRISVVGYLDDAMSTRLGGLVIENTEYQLTDAGRRLGNTTPVVTLTGRLADQAALLGILNALYHMCMPLISVECIQLEEIKGDKS